MEKVYGNPIEPGRLLELLTTEPRTKEHKAKLQQEAVSRMVSGIEWVDEEIWVCYLT